MDLALEHAMCNRRIYLDSNATTPPSKEVIEAMCFTAANNWGNPSSAYSEGAAARRAMDYARDVYAGVMKVHRDTVYFTSCGTESNNIALRSVMCRAMKNSGKDILLTSSIEHPSVKRTADSIGCRHLTLPTDALGHVMPETLSEALEAGGDHIGMISIIMGQNEFGTLQKIAMLVKVTRAYCERRNIPLIPFHTDATQVFGKYPGVEPEKLGVDMMTASAHKYHGPRGVGILYARTGLIDSGVTPMTGGGQERGCRSGTENVPAIFAAATALLQAVGDRSLWSVRMREIKANRDRIADILVQNIPGLIINGDIWVCPHSFFSPHCV